MGVEKGSTAHVDFKVGDTVQITAGPLEGFMGLVEGIDTETESSSRSTCLPRDARGSGHRAGRAAVTNRQTVYKR